MALQLFFRGQQIGDNYLKVESGDHLRTPPVKSVGLFQDTASINADSRNRVHARSFFVAMKRADNIALDEAISFIKQWLGFKGLIEVKDDSTVKIRCRDWFIEDVRPGRLRPGFGGRLADSIEIFAVGETPPQYF